MDDEEEESDESLFFFFFFCPSSSFCGCRHRIRHCHHFREVNHDRPVFRGAVAGAVGELATASARRVRSSALVRSSLETASF